MSRTATSHAPCRNRAVVRPGGCCGCGRSRSTLPRVAHICKRADRHIACTTSPAPFLSPSQPLLGPEHGAPGLLQASMEARSRAMRPSWIPRSPLRTRTQSDILFCHISPPCKGPGSLQAGPPPNYQPLKQERPSKTGTLDQGLAPRLDLGNPRRRPRPRSTNACPALCREEKYAHSWAAPPGALARAACRGLLPLQG